MIKKSWQITLLFLIVPIFIISGLILPKLRQISYLQNKIDLILNSRGTAERNNLQIKYHLPVYRRIKAKATKVGEVLDNLTWEKMILNLLQDTGLKLKSKNSLFLKKGVNINELKLNLTVSGRYETQMNFYKSIDRVETQTLLRRYTLKNLEILEQDPQLLGKFELSHFTLEL